MNAVTQGRAFAGARSDNFVFSPVRGRNRTKSFELVPGGRACISMGMKTADHVSILFGNEVALTAWLSQAAPGETIEYHRGFLGIDRTPLGQPMSPEDRGHLVRVAERAMRLAEQGLVHLVQRRLGADTFSYLAVARARPAGAALSFPTLIVEEAA
jgi:hypothetical protein